MRGALDPLGVDDGDLHVAAHGHELALRVAHHVAVDDLHLAFVAGFDLRLRGHLRRAADVERAHGELGARLADRLRRDHADRLADIDRRAAREIAPVALAADAIEQFAAQHGPHADLLHMRGVDLLGDVFGDLLAALDDDVAGFRMLHVLGRGTAQDALGERRHDLAAVDHGLDADALLGAAIFGRDDAVVGDVDEPAGEIARVGRLERGVGQTLARAVRRVEVLEHGEPFLEVGKDRRLDDLARRLRHQAAHAGQLLHLLLAAAGAGVRHHEDRVQLHACVRFPDRSWAARFPSSFRCRPDRCTSTRRR